MPSRDKKETSLKSTALPVIGRDITQISVPKIQIQRESQKTIICFGNFHAGD